MKVQDENARCSSMLVVCRKISSSVWKIFSTETVNISQIAPQYPIEASASLNSSLKRIGVAYRS